MATSNAFARLAERTIIIDGRQYKERGAQDATARAAAASGFKVGLSPEAIHSAIQALDPSFGGTSEHRWAIYFGGCQRAREELGQSDVNREWAEFPRAVQDGAREIVKRAAEAHGVDLPWGMLH